MRSICLPASDDFKIKHTPQLKGYLSHCTLVYWSHLFDQRPLTTLTKYKPSLPQCYQPYEDCFLHLYMPWSLLSPRERASSEASSSQPTNNTSMQARQQLIPLWLHISKRNCTSLCLKSRHVYICGFPVMEGVLIDSCISYWEKQLVQFHSNSFTILIMHTWIWITMRHYIPNMIKDKIRLISGILVCL